MEQYSSYYIEKELANMNIEVTRFTDVTYLLITKRLEEKRLLKIAKKYCKYPIGADGMDNVARALMLIDKGYDGLIHIKPFGCTPEIGAMKILQNVCNDNNIPIMFFTFDSQTSEVGIKTRLEAFYDMILMRRKKYEE
jgi:benzoyl-CoA reductase/2-hydroxyglutaryl-CoA dehydratase subunit BcrC/BadD/HgdB